MMLRLLVLLLVSGSVVADLTIPLTPVDASFVVHGNKLGAGQKLTITHSCVSCKIRVTARLYDSVDITSITAVDAVNSTYNGSTIGGATLTPPLSVVVGQNSSTQFVLAFTTVQLNETKEEMSYTSMLASASLLYTIRSVPDGDAFNISASGDPTVKLAMTVVSNAKSKPKMHLQGYTLIPANGECYAEFYAGGIPSSSGKNKYFLITLRADYQTSLVLSTIMVSAFTVVIPAGCDIRLFLANTPTTISRQLFPGSCGFAMSNEFPGNFVGEQDARDSSYEYALTDSNTTVEFSIIHADPGVGGSMTFFGNPKLNATLVLTGNSTSQKWDPLAPSPKVNWNPAGPSRNGFFYMYLVSGGHTESSTIKVETSTRSASTLSIGVWVLTVLVRILSC